MKRFLLTMSLLSFSNVVLAERHALVMGNAAYKVSRLVNPTNDVQVMSRTLRDIGFKVTPQVNLNRRQMRAQVRQLRSKLRSGDEVIFYFAGHGVQSEGNNYLLPVGHDIKRAHEVSDAGVSLNFILGELSGVPDTSIVVILDACRDNPFPGSNRTLSRGLARVERNTAGTLVAFAAASGQVSSDGQGKNGLYTSQLIKHLKTPNITINTMFNRVRKAVYRASGQKQYPEEKNMLMEDIYLMKRGVGGGASTITLAAVSATAHSHNDRLHDHPLPASGKNHQHNGAVTKPPVVRLPIPEPSRDYREPEMKLIRGGTFSMGSPASEKGRYDDEEPHSVRVGDFYLGKTEVTVGEFKRFVQAKGYRTTAETNGKGCRFWNGSEWADGVDKNWKRPGFSQTDQHPVACVSFDDAMAYAQWLSSVTGKRYGLPTEAQWEYAARAGTQTSRYWGNDIGNNQANCDGCGSQWDNKGTAPVGRFRANGFGLNDMLGNVWEWTCFEYDKSYAGGKEQRCVTTGSRAKRALRGGSWFYLPRGVRSAFRFWLTPTYRGSSVGFRLSRTP